jgi:hypothetical protein
MKKGTPTTFFRSSRVVCFRTMEMACFPGSLRAGPWVRSTAGSAPPPSRSPSTSSPSHTSASERTILRGIVALRVRANAKEARTHADVDSVRSLVASPPTIETFIPSGGSPGNQHSPRRPPSPPSPGRMCVGPSTSPAPLPRRDRRGHCSVLIGRGTAQPRNTKRRLRNRNDATFSGLAR